MVFLKISQNSQEKQPLSFIKKEILAQVYSCEFCEIFKDVFFYRTTSVAASESLLSLFKNDEPLANWENKLNINNENIVKICKLVY